MVVIILPKTEVVVDAVFQCCQTLATVHTSSWMDVRGQIAQCVVTAAFDRLPGLTCRLYLTLYLAAPFLNTDPCRLRLVQGALVNANVVLANVRRE
jgi:hypothetical protein